MKLSLRRIDTGQFIGTLMMNFRNLANERGISLNLEQPKEKAYVWADRDKLDKVMFNLLSNAFRFTPKGKSITVNITPKAEGVVIKVKDEGSGIAPERQKSIFGIFNSDNEGSVVNQHHTGIGLALTKDLVELHKGRIHVESSLGRGSTFIVELPGNKPGSGIEADYIMEDDAPYEPAGESMDAMLDATDSEVVPVADSTAEANTGDGSEDEQKNDRKTVLIVEDNAEMRKFIALILHDEYNIMTAADGKEGQEKATVALPDLIISDYMMPVMDGMEMAGRLRRDMTTSHIPIVMLSARTDEASVILGLHTGIDAYIEKPFSADMLRARIKNLIAMRRNLQQMYMDRFVNKAANKADGITLGRMTNDCNDKAYDGYNKAADTTAKVTDAGGRNVVAAPVAVDADQRFLARLTALLEENISNGDLSVDDVARLMGMSRSVYFKKIKALTGIGPNDYFKSLRLQRAAELLDAGELSITEISYSIGIADSHYFSKCFKQKFGVTPTEYRNR